MKILKSVLIVFTLITMILAVGGCTQSPEQKQAPINPKPTEEKVKLTLYFSDDQAMYLVPEAREVEKGSASLPELMVQELIQGPKVKGHGVTIPEGTKLLSLDVVDKVAFVNFSKEVQTNHWGGSAGETMTVYSVVDTLCQLPEIDQVQFLVEGEKQEAIWGNMDTTMPIKPDNALIKQ